jgi:microcystin-dependent protein
MTYADDFNIRTTSVKFNDVADAVDGVITRQYATTTGTSSAFIASPNPAWQAYVTSAILIVTPHTTNAAGATIQLNALPAKDMKIGGVAIPAGVLQTGVPTILAYTGTYFEVLLQSITVPVGQVTAYAGSTAPTGWLLCDASDLNTYTYRTLHAVISNIYGGTAYNPGTTDQPAAVTTFKVPDLRRRIPTGRGASDTLGFTEGGNNTGTAYASRSMSHSHTVPAHYHGMGTGATLSVNIAHSHGSSSVTGSVGGSDGTHAHTITDPGHLHTNNRRASATSFGNNASIAFPDGSGTAGTLNTDTKPTGISVDSTGSGHGHSFSLTAGGQTLGATATAPTGAIGLVTGGVDGNAQMTSGSTTPPYLFVNYIIKF